MHEQLSQGLDACRKVLRSRFMALPESAANPRVHAIGFIPRNLDALLESSDIPLKLILGLPRQCCRSHMIHMPHAVCVLTPN